MPERADLTAAIARIQQAVEAAGLEREISVVLSPGEITLQDGVEARLERGALRVTIATEQLLAGDPAQFAQTSSTPIWNSRAGGERGQHRNGRVGSTSSIGPEAG